MNLHNEIILSIEYYLRFLPYVSGFILFLVSGFKIITNYIYGKNCEEVFGIPYMYFSFDFIKSVIETLIYSFILIICVSLMIWIIFLSQTENQIITLISYNLSLFLAFSLFQMMINFDSNKKGKGFYIFVVIIFPLLISILVIFFQKKLIVGFIFLMFLLLLYILCILLYKIYKRFVFFINPENEKYQIVSITNERFAIVAKTKNFYVLIKLGFEDKIIKSKFILIDKIINIPIEYKKIF